MARKPSAETATAWTQLLRVQQQVFGRVEQDVKKAGFPPLSWHDVLVELAHAPHGAVRPVELEKRLAMPQYGLSRLIDRLVEAGLAERRQCPVDRRGLYVAITDAGRELQKKMALAYAGAVERHVGSKLSDIEAVRLSHLLGRLN
ncbi:MAG: MarR family transcriptional regulator [Xanthobacteraceae bacterium]|nr:MAG: MarR family transcriptional regulator [Xanthobacteraceae bacterium]